ncbi:MAG: hypothetical protein JW699_07645 [Chitinispirillaceae bacterium]|nr:hypothetical protein [Chitinispirillaceae bacterium]
MKRTFATDTGDAYSGNLPYYINFDYQFSSDSFIVKDPYDTNFVMYADLRPGYAGFKTAWDYGMTGFSVARYKYLVIAHKGPPAAHRVTVRAWYNDGGCGSPSYNEHLGTFSSSDVWKEDTIEIPAGVYNKPTDKERNQSKYYEFVFIVNNLDPNDTTSGPPGCLKIDNVRLVGCNPVDTSPKPQDVKEGEPATFRVSTSRADVADVLTFQWKRDGADIAGANDSVYTLASAKLEDAGVYTAAVTVSSTSLTFTSLGATLTVEAAEEDKGCGCGSGTAAALIPPFFFKAMAYRKRKKARKDMKA